MDYFSRPHLPVLTQKENLGTILHVHESVGGVAVAAASGADQDPGMPDGLGEQEPDPLEPPHQPLRLPARHAYHHACIPCHELFSLSAQQS